MSTPVSVGVAWSRLVAMEFLLVHSPLVGPTTWRWVADTLSAVGHVAAMPDLRSSALAGRPQAFIDAAVAAAPSSWSRPVVVGHSGAGFFVPSIAHRLDATAVVFVDAGIPPAGGPATAGADFLDQLRFRAVDGILAKWSTWWGPDVMQMLVPNPARLAMVEAELPTVPIAFYETPVELPQDWSRHRAAFLLLSDAYRADAERARARGWPLTERSGSHLDIVNTPASIAADIIDLVLRATL